CTKEFTGAGTTARRRTRWPGMVGRAVFSTCGDDQSGIATGAAPRPEPVAALSAERRGHGPAAGLDAPPGASVSAAPPPDADSRGAPDLERQDNPAHPGAS